jgi:hypothetical protein
MLFIQHLLLSLLDYVIIGQPVYFKPQSPSERISLTLCRAPS